MRTVTRRLMSSVVLACLIATVGVQGTALGARPGQAVVPYLTDHFGLNDAQVRGALGALLVYVRERLPKPQFDELAKSIPNAEQIMEGVKLRGIVTKPLDTIGDYEKALASLGIGESMASEFAPAVVEYLGATGFARERDILARAIH